jgi:hypothetical protein
VIMTALGSVLRDAASAASSGTSSGEMPIRSAVATTCQADSGLAVQSLGTLALRQPRAMVPPARVHAPVSLSFAPRPPPPRLG